MSAIATDTRPPAPATAAALPSDEADYPRARRFSRAEYYRAAETSVFAPGERLELIGGKIIVMSPIGPPHATGVGKSEDALRAAFASVRCHIRSQMPVHLAGDNEPEPDVVIARGGRGDYANAHPVAADVLLLIEVSDATLSFDRSTKAMLYAQNDIAEYWLLNLRERTLEVRRNPENGVYPPPVVYGENDTVTPLHAPQASPVRVADLLPSRNL